MPVNTHHSGTDVERAGGDSPLVRIVHAVADAADTDPLELPPLYDAVDPEALDALCRGPKNADLCVEFTYADHDVTVDGDGAVSVDPTVATPKTLGSGTESERSAFAETDW